MGYLKLLKIFGPLLIIALLFAHDRRLESLRAGWEQSSVAWEKKATDLVAVAASVAGVPKLRISEGQDAIRHIGADRDTYYGNWQQAKTALLGQTQRVVALGEETKRLQAESARQRGLVEKLTAQRDGWISKARTASTRTQRQSAQAEADACEAAMDALYRAGF